jgi:hypothetical protein
MHNLSIFLEGLRKTTKASVRIACVPVKFRTEYEFRQLPLRQPVRIEVL